VRMLRAAKYAASTGFAVPFALKRRIRSEARLLGDASSSRLTEELTKIISSGKSRAIAERLIDLRLLSYLLPAAASRCASKAFRVSFLNSLSELDASVPETGDSPQGLQLSFLLALLIEDSVDWSLDPIEAYPMAVQAARDALSPLNLPRVEVECAVRYVFRRRGIPLLQRHMRPRDESRERDEGRRREGPLSRDGRGKGEEAKRDRADPGADERAAGDPGRRRKRRGRGRGRRPGGDAGGSQGGGSEGAKP
jgi:poly(A) polymerase